MSGIMIMTNKQFRMGDLIEFMYNGEYTYFGRIEEITLRYTVMRKLDYRRTIIPNYFLTSYPIITYSSEPTVRLETRCSVPLDTDISSCKKQMLTAINALDFIVEKEFTLVLVEDIGVTGINILIYFYIDPKAGRLRFRAVSDVSHAIADIFTAHGISFTLPHTVITVDPLHPREQEVIQKAAEQVYG